jgi:diguanylate cyclase (GGDEF)-like protein/PAS domain S-box-containing protein
MRADIILHTAEPVEDKGARWVSAQRELTDLLLYPPGLALEQVTLLRSIERSNEGLVRLQGYLVGIQERQKGVSTYLQGRLLAQLETMHEDALRIVFIADELMQQRLFSAQRYGVALLVITGLILTVLALRLARSVTRSLLRINRGIEYFAKGELAKPIQLEGNNELTDLARHLNKMAAQLSQLSVVRDDLQDSVAARTQELETSRQALLKSELRYRSLFDNMDNGVIVLELLNEEKQAIIQGFNRASEAITGVSMADAIGQSLEKLFPGIVDTEFLTGLFYVHRSGQVYHFNEKRYQDGGQIEWISGHAYRLHNNEVVVVYEKVTERKIAEDKLKQAATVFAEASEAVVITDGRLRVLDVNRAFSNITQFGKNSVIGKRPGFLKAKLHNRQFFSHIKDELKIHGRWSGEITDKRRDGSVYPCWMSISEVLDDRDVVANYVAIFSDITDIKRSQQKLQHMVQHDALTGLANRSLLNAQLDRAIAVAQRHRSMLAVAFIDLDRFKSINDCMGHPAGDEFLQRFAERLQGSVRKVDLVARISGDEFVVLIEDVVKKEDAQIAVKKLMEVFTDSFLISGQELRVTGSIGVSVFPDDGENSLSLMRNADVAMYSAKRNGRNTYEFYREDMSVAMLEHVLLENALRGAIQREELSLVYQPQINIKDGRIIGAEVLLRWRYPQVGNVSPDVFIPMAENNGLIHAIGAWVLEHACLQVKSWQSKGLTIGRMAINVAAPQLMHMNYIRDVEKILLRTGVSPQSLEFEVTESSIIEDTEQAIRQIERVRALGIEFAMDDFGTGYSSLSYLKKLPINRLKIDRSFVSNLPYAKEDTAIAEAIIAMSKALQLQVIAEGVETAEQAMFLLNHGCTEAQGYFYSKPVSAAEIEKMMIVGNIFKYVNDGAA